jgi:bisphosphoglycerate-independent phosphoglycerate mutase (AlkP superfamily)
MDYLDQHKPKLLYIAYDETDEYAHEGKYDQYLMAANRLDKYVAELWNWTQKNNQYKNKTTILITTDHGRGHETIDAWRNHGSSVAGAEHVWMAVLGPDTPSRGEISDGEPMTSSQIAATIGAFLGFGYSNEKPVGPVMHSMFYDTKR